MKKTLFFLGVLMLLTAHLAFAANQQATPEGTIGQDGNILTTSGTGGNADDPADEPEKDPDSIIQEMSAEEQTHARMGVEKCLEILKTKDHGMNDAEIRNICRRFTGATAGAIASGIRASVRSHTMANVERIASQNPGLKDNFESLDEENQRKFMLLSRARQNELASENKAEIEAQLSRMEIKKPVEEKRLVAKDKAEHARKTYHEARSAYASARAEYAANRQEFSNHMRAERQCYEGTDDALCEQYSENSIAAAKAYLMNLADMVIYAMEQAHGKAVFSEDITEDEAIEIKASLEDMLLEINAVKDEILAAETKEDVKEAGRKITSMWAQSQARLRVSNAHLVYGSVRSIVARAEGLEKRLSFVIARMDEEGKETEEIQLMIDEYSALVNMAKKELIAGKELLTTARHTGAHAKPADEHIRLAHEHARQASAKLKEIVSAIKTAGGNLAVPATMLEEFVVVER